jgi:hypothetical protein
MKTEEEYSNLIDFVNDINFLEDQNSKLKIPSIKVLMEIKVKTGKEDDLFTFCILTEQTLQLYGKIKMISREEKSFLYKIILESVNNKEFDKPSYGGRQISDDVSYSYKINWDKIQIYDTLKDRMPLGFSKIIDAVSDIN